MILPFIRHSMNLYINEKYDMKTCTSYLKTCGMGFFANEGYTFWERITILVEASVSGTFVPIFPFISLYLIGLSASVLIHIAMQQQELSRKRRIKEFLIHTAILIILGFVCLPINMTI